MRRLLLCAFLSLAWSHTSAQSLVETWKLIGPQEPELEAGTRIHSMWMEVAEDGRVLVHAEHGTQRSASLDGALSNEGCLLGMDSEPVCPEFLSPDRVRLEADEIELTFERSRAPVEMMGLVGSWRISKGPAESVTFRAGPEGGATVRFYLRDQIIGSGTWMVNEKGLTVETGAFGTELYTRAKRDGARVMLTGNGEPLVLEPMKE
ncbi:MAG: hypothetical protein AAGI52_11710 [Bacteroidota bacterium]